MGDMGISPLASGFFPVAFGVFPTESLESKQKLFFILNKRESAKNLTQCQVDLLLKVEYISVELLRLKSYREK